MTYKSLKNKLQIVTLLIPGLLIFGLFTIYPIVKLFVISFFQWDFSSILNQSFLGFDNYKAVFREPYFLTAFVYTLV